MAIPSVSLTTFSNTAYTGFTAIPTPGAGGGRGNTQACGLFVTMTASGAPGGAQTLLLVLTDGVKVYCFYDLTATASTPRGNIDGTTGEYLCALVDNTTSLPIRAFDTLGADGEGLHWRIAITNTQQANVTAVNVYCPTTQVV